MGSHPIPFRTRPLSPSSPMILGVNSWESRSPPGFSFQKAPPQAGPFLMWPPVKSQSSWVGADRVSGTRKQAPRCTSRDKPLFCFLFLFAPYAPSTDPVRKGGSPFAFGRHVRQRAPRVCLDSIRLQAACMAVFRCKAATESHRVAWPGPRWPSAVFHSERGSCHRWPAPKHPCPSRSRPPR